MASVGEEQGDNGLQDGEEDSVKLMGVDAHDKCHRNGIHPACQCGDITTKSLDSKRTKSEAKVRINGVNRTQSVKPCVASGPTERTFVPAHFTTRKRKSSKPDQKNDSNGLIHLKNGTCRVELCVNNNQVANSVDLSGNNNPSMHLEAPLTNGTADLCTCAHSNHIKHSGDELPPAALPPAQTTRTSPRKCHKTDVGSREPIKRSVSTLEGVAGLPCGPSRNCANTAYNSSNISGSHYTSLTVNTTCTGPTKRAPNSPMRIGASCMPQGNKEIRVCTPKKLKYNNVESVTKAAPANSTASDNNRETCKWDKCGRATATGLLMEHIKTAHVDTQVDHETFVCLWHGCKVYNKQSCSLSWLERHVVSHSGDKPFRCIVDGCCLRFTSQVALQRHVNSHFNTYQSSTPKSSRSERDTPSKLLRKKKLKGRRSRLVKTDDYFDCHVMEKLKQRVADFNTTTHIDTAGDGHSLTFQSTVIANRTDTAGQKMCLLHWTPEGILPDEWVAASQAMDKARSTIPLAQLPQESLVQWDSCFYRPLRYRKHRRK